MLVWGFSSGQDRQPACLPSAIESREEGRGQQALRLGVANTTVGESGEAVQRKSGAGGNRRTCRELCSQVSCSAWKAVCTVFLPRLPKEGSSPVRQFSESCSYWGVCLATPRIPTVIFSVLKYFSQQQPVSSEAGIKKKYKEGPF